MSLKGKTLFITGASRGIGYAIGLRAAQDGANIVIAAKTETENPKLPGTIHSAAQDMINAGGKALAIACDIRFEDQVRAAIDKAVETFGGIDILVNNASAINLKGTLDTEMKRFDLIHQVNARGTFLCSKYALPHLKKSSNPHILTLSPPLNMKPHWFSSSLAYTLSKYGMSMCTIGLAAEFKKDGVAVNSLWPETIIATAAVKNLLGGDLIIQGARHPQIVADAAYEILNRDSKTCTGNFFLDVEVLKEAGVTDFSQYAVDKTQKLHRDFFLDDWFEGIPPDERVAPPAVAATTEPEASTDTPVSSSQAEKSAESPSGTGSSEPAKTGSEPAQPAVVETTQPSQPEKSEAATKAATE